MKIAQGLIGLVVAALVALPALATTDKEAFVRENGQQVLEALNDESLDAEARTDQFGSYMEEFTDIDAVSNFVIGKYARRFSDSELANYREAFKRYALAVYEVELDRYRGEEINVTGSTERNERDAIVETVIRRSDGQELEVLWRVMDRDGELQVMDVALNIEGNLIWLAIEQRAQLLAVLDRNNGRAEAVVEKLNQMTEKLEAEKRAARGTAPRNG